MKQDRRGSWYLLTGVLLGVAIGLVYSWVVSPVQYVDAPPYALRSDYKDDYRALVAAAYLYSGDLVRAQDRLAQLKDDEIAQTIAQQAQRALAEGHPEAEVRALGILAMALSQRVTTSESVITPTLETTMQPPISTLTSTPLVIETTISSSVVTSNPLLEIGTSQPAIPFAPPQTETPTPTQGAPFALKETKLVCDINQPDPLIQVQLENAAGQPVPSIEIGVSWDGGKDQFYTGLKPELGLGYADFVMTPNVVYSIQVGNQGQAINNLTAARCMAEDGSQYWGSWLLTFIQP